MSVDETTPLPKLRRRPTLQDVAAAVGVSVMTVSRALNGNPRVSKETRQKVLAEAERVGYRPSFSARALRSQESRLIGFHSPDLMLPVHVEIIQGARDIAAEAGYRLFLHVDIPEDETNSPFTSDGDLIMGGPPPSPQTHLRYDPQRTVGLMNRTNMDDIDICGSDLVQATLDAFHHLIAVGYRRIGLLQHVGNSPRFGREAALREAGIDADDNPELVQVVGNDKESVVRGLHRLMALPQRPDAIAVVHVAGTPYVLRELQQRNFVIGRDIGFVGTEVSRSEWGDLVAPRMTALRVPGYEIGAEGARRLIARLRGDRSAPRRYEFPVELVIRESTPGPWGSV